MISSTKLCRSFIFWLTCLFLAAVLAACTTSHSNFLLSASDNDTGIAVAAEFREFYNQRGGLRIFGYPITDSFVEQESGRVLQYFQRMRLEYDPGLPPGERVIIAPLGEWAYAGVRSAVPTPVSEGGHQRYFPETGLTVQDEFLTFYEANHGEKLFGPPISPQLDEGGSRVQYFRNARLEWRPEAPLSLRVQPGLLGQAHFVASGAIYPYGQQVRARPVDSAGVRAVNVFASVKAPILYAGDQQIVYVEVVTPEGWPVAGIPVSLVVNYNGSTHNFSLGTTNNLGKVQGPIELPDPTPGQQVQLSVSVHSLDGNVVGNTMLSFKTWW